ncbi:hypothetical protein [Streptomyces sp. NPDC057682]|uniref:hypothetical protein n=1 Tax=unclassified Streptomyces TaxID=2593676 RepID=UPI00364CC332
MRTLKIGLVPDGSPAAAVPSPDGLAAGLSKVLTGLGVEHVHVVRGAGRLDAILYFLAEDPLGAEREICRALRRSVGSGELRGLKVDVCELDFYLSVGLTSAED